MRQHAPKDLVVLGQTLRAAGSTGLDLAGGETDDKIGDEGVLSLAAAVAHLHKAQTQMSAVQKIGHYESFSYHDTPAVLLRDLRGLDCLGHSADLIDFEKQTVA